MPIPADDPRMEGIPDKGKAVVGMKRRPTEDVSAPTMKWLCVDSHPSDLEAVDNLANLMDSTWDEVVKARKVVSMAEEHL